MKRQTPVIVFIIILAIHLAGLAINNKWIEYITKPMLVVSLAFYFLSLARGVGQRLKTWILAALFFSWAGDVLLLFQPVNNIFFLLGLCSFLIAHIFYILLFHHIRVTEGIVSKIWLLLIVVIYYALLILLLYPHLDDMKIAVPVYGIAISFMLWLALHMLFIKNKTAGRWMMTGALLFVISDSLLAINKFYQPFQMAGLAIMVTYGLAQLYIIMGAINYLTSVNNRNNFNG